MARRRQVGVIPTLLTVLVVAVVTTMSTSGTVASAAPDVLPIKPTSGPPGADIEVTPTFPVQGQCQIVVDKTVVVDAGEPCGAAQGTPYPSFTITAPGGTGDHLVQACQPSCSAPGAAVQIATFTVVPEPSSPASDGSPAPSTPTTLIVVPPPVSRSRSRPAPTPTPTPSTTNSPSAVPSSPADAAPAGYDVPLLWGGGAAATTALEVVLVVLHRARRRRRPAVIARTSVGHGRRGVVCTEPSPVRRGQLEVRTRRTRTVTSTAWSPHDLR